MIVFIVNLENIKKVKQPLILNKNKLMKIHIEVY